MNINKLEFKDKSIKDYVLKLLNNGFRVFVYHNKDN